ncbi:MAG: WecB/TagA/CpsF family glycosyltransferase [Pseudomonadota bacterium]
MNVKPPKLVLDVPVHPLTEPEVVAIVEREVDAGHRVRIGVVNAAKIIAMHADRMLWDDVTSSDLVLADGMSVVWASRILGQSLPERVAGIDLMFRLFELADRKQLRVFLLGATEEVSAIIEANLARDYPSLVLAGRRNGYFSAEESAGVAEEIAACKPHILLVAMTTPKKENFMGRFDAVMGVPVVHGVGGSFDVYSGKVERAPVRWQKLGLEWLYRVKQEPGRLWKRYLITNVKFSWMVLLALLRRPFVKSPS